MKFRGLQFKPTGKEPKELAEFLAHYASVNMFLTQFNVEKLSTTDNIAGVRNSLAIPHGTLASIPHNLGFTPSGVIVNGRVEFTRIVSKTSLDVKVICKLHTVELINPTPGTLVNRIEVSDGTFFVTGDLVRIGNQTRSLKGKIDNLLLIEGNILYEPWVKTLSLATDTLDTFVF